MHLKDTPIESLENSLIQEIRDSRNFQTYEEWLKSDEAMGYSANYIRSLGIWWRKYGHLSAADIYNVLSARTDIKPQSKNAIIAHLKRFKPGLKELPCFKSFRRDKIKPVFEPHEIKLIVNSKLKRMVPYTLMIYTGCRIGEMYHIRRSGLLGNQTRVNLQPDEKRGEMKTGERVLFHQPELLKCLDRQSPVDPGTGSHPEIPFRWHLHQYSLASDMRRIGIDLKDRTYHSFRHTYAALMLASGVSPMILSLSMGHSNPAQTQHYAKSALSFMPFCKDWIPGHFQLIDPEYQKED